MSAHGPNVSHARHEFTPLVIAGAIVLVIVAAGSGVGGDAMLAGPQSTVANPSELANSVGRGFYPLEDGISCRDVKYKLASGEIISSSIRPCADGALAEPRRKFIWSR